MTKKHRDVLAKLDPVAVVRYQITEKDVRTIERYLKIIQAKLVGPSLWQQIQAFPGAYATSLVVHELVEIRLLQAKGIKPFKLDTISLQQTLAASIDAHIQAIYEEHQYLQDYLTRQYKQFFQVGTLLKVNRDDEEEAINSFVAYAGEIGLDEGLFEDELRHQTYREKILQAYEFARNNDLNYAPAMYINGYEYPTQSFGLSQAGIAAFLAMVPLLDNPLPPPFEVIDPSETYTATMITEKGDILINLFPDTAPINVNSFVYLARHDWYDDTTFHRVIPDFVAQGGDPSGTGLGWPGYYCDDEIHPDRTFDQAGVVAFVNSGANTNGGQIFITYRPIPHLNGNFTIIGQVISGQDVVESLTPRDPMTQPDFVGDKIIDVRVAGVIEEVFLPVYLPLVWKN